MRYRTIGTSDLAVSEIGFGCGLLFSNNSGETAHNFVASLDHVFGDVIEDLGAVMR